MKVNTLQLRKALSAALFVLLLSVVGITKTMAQSFTVGNLNYSVNSDGISVTLTGHVDGTAATGSLSIPESVTYEESEYSVTIINNSAFYNCSGFTGNLTIPNSVTTIGIYAFYGCAGFNGNLTIPNSVTTIGSYAFYNCSSFAEVQFNAANCTIVTNALHPGTINPAFQGCGGTLVVGNNVESIGPSMFKNGGFSEVIFNATNCADANGSVFNGCSGSLIIGNNVERIPAYMFNGGNFTGSLTIGTSVTSIGNGAFQNCSGFTEVVFNATNCADANGTVFNGCSGSINIGDNVERIPAYLFNNCSGFTGNLTIPNSVTEIGYQAFYNCSGFTGGLTMPNSVTSIGGYAFYGCSGFNGNLTIPKSVTEIGNYAFRNCSGFTGVIFNAINCTDFNSNYPPFQGCGGFFVIGDEVERIPAYILYNCNSFTGSLTIPNSVTEIGNYAFRNCSGFIGGLTISNSVTSIGSGAFQNCSGFDTVIYNAVDCADCSLSPFKGCDGTLIIGDSVERIPTKMFQDCSDFTGGLTIPNSVTSICGYAFYGCSGFTGNLTIPSSVTEIGNYAFRNCSGFTGVFFNAINCSDFNSNYPPFQGCGGFFVIGNEVERIPAHILYNCNSFTGNLTIPNSVTEIGSYAFRNCSGFTGGLTIPSSVISIGGNAFYGCSGFTGSLTIPSSMVSIGGYAFQGCSGFTGVVFNATNCADCSGGGPFSGCGNTLIIGDNVERIPAMMFYNCSSFTGGLTIPNSVTEIGYKAFYNCSGFTGGLAMPNSVTSIGDNAFYGCSGFTGILTIPKFVTSIGNSAFQDCNGFTEVVFNAINCADVISTYMPPFQGCGGTLIIGNEVERIPEGMFYGCSGFTGSLIIPNSVTIIGYRAFFNCSGFTDNLTIGNSVTSIEGYAFYNCSSFTSINSFAETPPSIYYNAFSGVNLDIPITVPCGTTNTYQNVSGWNQFTNYQEDCSATIISAEICYGENYLENGFEIIQPEVGEGEYFITVPSSQGTDSIVNLTLTVYPTYYFVEDTTLCNATSFQWHGNTYTESGIYYDTLQTIHGCDSIYALSLEFFNTLLGEFTYMTPTNNYPFTSLPIIFNWDAVSGAEYYDLYVWDEDEPMPNVPFVSNLTGRNFSTTALLNYHTYNWFVTARNACYETSSTVKSFYLDIEPSLSVNLNQIDFGEVTFNQSVSTPMSVSGVVLEDTLNVQIVGDDAAMFSFTKASGWNDYTGGFLIVTFHPTVPQYSYNANLVISSGTLTTTTSLTGGLADMFVFNTYVAEDVYAMNSPIPIYGSLTDVSSIPVANAEVEIGVFVMGMKRTLQAVTNESGQFSAVFEPMPSESGYYTVNSGRVGNHSTTVHDDFNIPGMTLVSSDYILCAVTQDQPKTDSILIRNKSNLNLNNIQVSPISVPDGTSFNFMPLSLNGLEENWLVYTVNGSTLTQGNYYEEAKLKATSSEGAEMNISIWYYCMEPRGVLDVMPKSLATTMTKGKSKIVDVMLTNNGTAATGNITIDLPDVEWMSVVGNDTLSSIAVNDTAYFSLRFSPAEDIQLGQYSGTIAINSERGDAVALPYTITAVSDSTGTLMIDVTDDFTWNTNNGNGPHLEGAEVTLKGYYSLETVAYGFTDADGHFSVEDLPEGYYRLSVTAERHTDYNSIVFIEAGATGRSYTNVYLQYQAVTYSWIVEPTEIEDEYTYELVVNYETNVPVPVITIEHSGIHLLEYGESANFNLIITNHGLISAFDTHIYFSESNEYIFTPLYDVIDTLQALSTYVVPGTYTRINNSLKSNDEDCDLHVRTISIYYCNRNGTWTSLIENYSPPFFGQYTVCHTHSDNDYGSGVLILNGGDGDGRLVNHHFGQGQPIVTNNQVCSSCLNELAKSLVGCLAKPLECMLFNGAYDYLTNSSFSDAYINQIMCAISALIEQLGSGGLSCLIGTCYNLSRCINIQFNDVTRDNVDFIQNTIDNLYFSSLYYANELSIAKSFFAEESWDYEENIVEFFDQVKNIMDVTTGFIEESDAHQLASTFVGTSASYDDIIAFINRWNRSLEYWSNGYFMLSDLPEGYNTDFVQIDADLTNEMLDIEDYYSQLGYEDMADVYSESLENANTIIGNASQSSVCAHVTVKFSQKMTMTREAFDGTLTIYNGHPTEPIEAINVNFVIKDSAGNDCTSLFQINTLSLNNITGIDGTGSIGGGMDGIAKIQFIPTRLAAPTMPKVYYFGGSFSFIDPYTGEEIYYDLYPVEITVNPSPDLYVDYFMQRDILGDDALTLDVFEPSVPAELGVIINNKGAGMAKNVLLETAEPQIIDNDKGLAIDFAMYGASLNGSPRQLGLMEIPFGNIGSGQTVVGEWLFTSSLLGHFVSYEAHVIHNSSYGNPDLSLVSHLDIHELIHPIYAYGNLDDGINDFLVNDTPDAYDTPDSIYFSHGGKTSVGVVDDISFDHLVFPSDTIITLTVEPSRIGWNYGVTDDPGMYQYNIVSCIRNNDNQVIPLNNVWLTFVTIPDGGDPVYENKLHIVDTIPVQQTTTYTLVFAKKPSNLRIFHGNEDEYWSNAANWEGNIIPQADDEVLINGICQLDEDVEVFSLTVAEDQSLTIPEDRILTVSGQLTSASVSRLIIEEGGQLFHGNTGVQATLQKTIMPYTEGENDGWYFIASPLAGSTSVTSVANMLDNEYDLYYYDEPTAYWMNQEYTPNGFSELVNGKGYLYANSDEILLGFAGELQSGSSTVTVFLNYTEGGDLQGFNLVGNPFVYNLTSYASVNVANGCYQMNEAKDDLIVSEITEANPLKPAEGFFVKATNVGASITFNPGRSETTNRSSSIHVELLDDGKLIDRLIVKIEGEPLEKMSLKEQRTKLFAMQDRQEIAIVLCEGNEQPVNFKAVKNGTYTINVNANDLEFNYLHLIDNLTGADVDLLALRQAQGPMSYTFEAKTSDYASRFRLVFSVCGDADGDNAPFAFINNGNIIVTGAEAGAVLQIVDVLGHVIVSTDVARNVSTNGMTSGVYILRLINGNDVKTQKIVID